MSNVSLFEAAQALRDTIGRVDPLTGEIDESYIQSLELFRKKAVACIAYLIEEDAAIDAAERAARAITDRIGARRARLERFRAYVRDAMAATNTESIEDQHGLFRATLHRARDVSVEIDDGAIFPPELCADPKPPAPSKSRIRAAIEAGLYVDGARIVRRDRLVVR